MVYLFHVGVRLKSDGINRQMETQRDWSRRHRIESWNILYKYAQITNQKFGRDIVSMSPFLTTAFLYLAKYYSNSDIIQNRLDRITVLFASVFVTSKQFKINIKFEQHHMIFCKIMDRLSEEQKEFFGSTCDIITPKEQNEEEFQRFKSIGIQAELDFLTTIKWEFITETPFKWFNEWHLLMRNPIRPNDPTLRDFRAMRDIAVHNLILFLVVSDDIESLPLDIVSVAVFQDALMKRQIKQYSPDKDSEFFG